MDDIASKRDRRRQSLSLKLHQMNEMFERDKDLHYRDMLRVIQDDLYMLLVGKNEEFLQELADVEEIRDEQLVGLYLWRQYQLESTEREYEREVEQANEEHQQMTEMVKQRLMSRLEAQRKRLSEDKLLLDMANDHSLFLSGSVGSGAGMTGYYMGGGFGAHNGGSSALNGGSGDDRHGSGADTLAGLVNGVGGFMPGSPGQDSSSRRTRRRKGEFEEPSGISGNEGSATGGGGGGGGAGTRRRAAIQSDIDAFSDMDKVIRDRERESTKGQKAGAYQRVKPLKAEEASEDLALIRAGIKRSRGAH